MHKAVDDEPKSLFHKPHIDDMGPGTDMAAPAGAVSRSLFKKNNLDEMTVRRTETPVEGIKPIKRAKIGAGSYEDSAEAAREKKRPGKSGRPGLSRALVWPQLPRAIFRP